MQGLDPFPNVPLRAHQPSTTEMLLSTLGASLGQSIPKAFQQQYQAEQYKTLLPRLEAARNDPNALINLALTPGLSPEHSKAIIGLAENAQKTQQEAAQTRAIEKFRGLPEGTLKNVAPNIATSLTKPAKEPAPIGGLGGMAIPPEQQALIDEVMARPGADKWSGEKLTNELSKAGVFPHYADERGKLRTEDQKYQAAQMGSPLEIHKLTTEFDNKIADEAKTATSQLHSINEIRDAIKSNDVGPDTIFGLLNLVSPTLAKIFTTKEQQKFITATKNLYEGVKDMFGIRLSDADLKLIEGMMPDPSKTVEANMAAVDFLEFGAKMKKRAQQIGAEIKNNNNGFRPLRYADEIRERLDAEFGDQLIEHYQSLKNKALGTAPAERTRPPNIPPNFVRVSNGTESFWISPDQVEAAKKDKFELSP